MKKVRILKDGDFEGVEYKIGEIWDFVEDYTKDRTIVIKKDNKRTIVSISNDTQFGKEAEIIEEQTCEIQLIL